MQIPYVRKPPIHHGSLPKSRAGYLLFPHLQRSLRLTTVLVSVVLLVAWDPHEWVAGRARECFFLAAGCALAVCGWPLLRHFLYRSFERERCLIKNRLKPNRIIIARHAESLGNTDLSTYARVPDNQIPLSPAGVEQARQLGARLREIVGEESCRFFVSPYKRTWQTLDHLLETMRPSSYTVREEPRVREQDWGNFQTDPALITAQIEERRRFGSFFYRLQNGESGADVYARVDSFWSSVFREFEYQDCLQNFIIISHGISARLLLMRYFGWTVEVFHALHNFENCQIAILEKDSTGKYQLITPIHSNLRL